MKLEAASASPGVHGGHLCPCSLATRNLQKSLRPGGEVGWGPPGVRGVSPGDFVGRDLGRWWWWGEIFNSSCLGGRDREEGGRWCVESLGGWGWAGQRYGITLINLSRLEDQVLGTWTSRGGWMADQPPWNTHALHLCSSAHLAAIHMPWPHLGLFIIWLRYLQGPAAQPCSNFSLPGPHCSKKKKMDRGKKWTSWVVFQPPSPQETRDARYGTETEGLWNESQNVPTCPRAGPGGERG